MVTKSMRMVARSVPRTVALLIGLLCCWSLEVSAAGQTAAPFASVNQSPVSRIFGIPAAASPWLLDAGDSEGSLTFEVANNYLKLQNFRESLLLDGESYRFTTRYRRGMAGRYQVGIDLPLLSESGGSLDGFIEGWHRTFALPSGGRTLAPRNRLTYRYIVDGRTRLAVDRLGSGLGDLQLHAGLQLYRATDEAPAALALIASVKLPTGDSDRLRGSGSTDFALELNGGLLRATERGHWFLTGTLGGMAMTQGEVLAGMQKHQVGFGSLCAGFGPADWIDLKLQLNGHTPLFSGSDLSPLSGNALQLDIGGTLRLAAQTFLDLSVSEDLLVHTAPDVGLQVALRSRF